MRVHVFLAGAAVIGGVGLACGGAADSGLFGGASSDTGNGVDAGSSSSTPDAAPPSTGEDAAPPPPEDASSGTDSGAPPDASPPPQDSGPAQDPGVQCGSSNCSVPSEACCRRQVTGNYSYMCLPTGTCQGLNTPTLEIPCDDSSDCAAAGNAGQVCCVTIGGGPGGGNAASEVVCRDPSECLPPQYTRACDVNDPNACPSNTKCKSSAQTLPGYTICY